MSLELNEYERFQQEFGDYVTYDLNRERVLDGFYAAYQKEKPLEELILVSDPADIEDDLFDHFTDNSSWFESILKVLASPLSDGEDSSEYADFADDFEIEEAGANMLYWCRYEP